MRKPLLMSGLFVLLLASPSHTASAQQDAPCANANSQFELNQCMAREYQQADAEMNRIYKQLMAQSEKSEKPMLRAAQLAWLKLRDAECDYENSPQSKAQCPASRTRLGLGTWDWELWP